MGVDGPKRRRAANVAPVGQGSLIGVQDPVVFDRLSETIENIEILSRRVAESAAERASLKSRLDQVEDALALALGAKPNAPVGAGEDGLELGDAIQDLGAVSESGGSGSAADERHVHGHPVVEVLPDVPTAGVLLVFYAASEEGDGDNFWWFAAAGGSWTRISNSIQYATVAPPKVGLNAGTKGTGTKVALENHSHNADVYVSGGKAYALGVEGSISHYDS